jgi:limonene 1,2-monooxygenase
MSQRLRFGIFLAPFHKPGINPTLALQSDLDLIQWLDRCGYDEAWLGEHHSAGTELSASPEIMIATAAERTRHIKLGTGVISVSYHNPLWVAERIVLLDHLTRGRAMLGLGPGSLPTDGVMIGLQQSQTRGLLEDGVAIITKLLTSEEPVTFKNDRFARGAAASAAILQSALRRRCRRGGVADRRQACRPVCHWHAVGGRHYRRGF